MRKEWEVIGDIVIGIGGIALIIFPITSYPVFFILGAFLVVISATGVFVDIKIVEKRIEMPSWWKWNLPFTLGILLLNSDIFYTQFSSTDLRLHEVSVTNYIILTSMGATLWILAFGYDIWRKYNIYLKNNHGNKTK